LLAASGEMDFDNRLAVRCKDRTAVGKQARTPFGVQTQTSRAAGIGPAL
jgi:hypothetical protein